MTSEVIYPATLPEALGLIHGMPNSAYHRSAGLSSSGIKLLCKSPWHHFATHQLERPAWALDELDDDTTGALFAGTLCHCATLEPLEFDRRYVVGPDARRNSKQWHDFVAANAPRIAITAKQRHVAVAQAAALQALPAVAELIDGGEFEVSAYWRDPATGVLCRCRPDVMNRTFGTPEAPAVMLLDVKTTSDASVPAIRNSIARYGYHLQAEHYSRGVATALALPVIGFVFAFVESAYPFGARVVELDPESFEVARRNNRDALNLYAACEESGQWPGYSREVEFISLPRWAGGGE